ncbi:MULTISPECIES: pyrroline-5-carboxylate reductase [unclassified Brevibacterium]|uniref:pyrroline-5-carboxylate reductase n=1 Tax=unclassified Brevibacterium TaxID=2614124 RepID=UPI001E539A4B|nr:MULTISPECIES: pyrroline-5-carboxylate reductase [unclassified Brevibacterium]MCD1287076.1 pyrroline-5-carboxylate reductase [Brevibacterium sp. CCUG 69071]MDK8436305.1 pyrroline-5-carboxylate reductase [Brevibacterium sp. H-BE7]
MTSIASIGTGNMGTALIKGILSADENLEVRATTNSAASAQKLSTELPNATVTAVEDDPEANRKAAAGADFVLLGVKPWMMAETLRDLAAELDPQAVLVSMAAGVASADLAVLAPGNPIVRIMPNTPSSIGHGVIALAPDAEVDSATVKTLHTLLSGAGLVVELSESEIPAMTGISGSGVAYFFLLAEAMIAAGVKMGLSEESAKQMVVATADGAGRLLSEKPDPAAQRQAVSSKGGTTLAGLSQFLDSGIFDIAEAAARAAGDRSLEMERENSEVING